MAWFNPQNSSSGFSPEVWGLDIEESAPLSVSQCSGNRGMPGQSAKAFWDLDDDRNEDGESGDVNASWDDRNDRDTLWIAEQWDGFPNGTGNREDSESDIHGVNLWDYLHHASSQSSVEETLLEHNCVQTQTTG